MESSTFLVLSHLPFLKVKNEISQPRPSTLELAWWFVSKMPEKTRLEYKKFAAWIEVDRKALTCYALDMNKKENHVSCWIASEEGKNFTINFRKEETKVDCQISAKLDGMKLGGCHFKKKETGNFLYSSIRTSSTIKRSYMFSPLQTTDDDNYANSVNPLSESAEELGEISVKIHRVTRIRCPGTVPGIYKERGDNKSKYNVPEPLKVHESSRKAAVMPHQIVFGEERIKKSSGIYATADIHELLATFVFRYRPLGVLHSCGIVHIQPTLPSMDIPRGEPSLTEGSSTEMPRAEVQVRQEDPGNIRLPEALHPLENSTVSNGDISPPDLENQVEVTPKQEEDKPDISDDDDDEVTKILMAEVEKRRNEKRKAKEAAAGQRKRIKREAEVLTFFKPGEVSEVIDLT